MNGFTAPQSVTYANGNAILDFGGGDAITLLNISQSQYQSLSGAGFGDHWTNGSGGTWTTGSDWSLGVPNSNEAAVIDASGSYSVTISTAVSVSELSTISTATLDITTGTLTLSGMGTSDLAGAVQNSGTITVENGTLDLSGGLSGAGSLVIDAGATLQLGGAGAQAVTFSDVSDTLQDTLQLDNGHGLTGTISGLSSTSGSFVITGQGNITTTSGDAIDFASSGGTSGNGNGANVTLTPSGTLTGAANGIKVVQNGVGDLTVDASGDVTGNAGDGVLAKVSANAHGNIVVDDTGSVTGNGSGSIGLLAENLDAGDNGDITITQAGASGGSYGIEALNYGSGDTTVDSSGAVTATVEYWIRALSYGTGDVSVNMDEARSIPAAPASMPLMKIPLSQSWRTVRLR